MISTGYYLVPSKPPWAAFFIAIREAALFNTKLYICTHPMKILNQLRSAAPILVIAYAFTTAILSVVIFLGMEHNIELDHFTQDPSTIMETPWYLGFFSYIGILFWCASATLCFYTRVVLPPGINEFKEKRKFLLWSGLITSLLLFDDLFLFHETVLPDYFYLPRNVVYLIYLNILFIYVIIYRTEILQSEYVVLVMASGLMGISQFVDMLPMPIPEDSFLEDAVKLFAIVTWFIYYGRYCLFQIRKYQEMAGGA